MTRDFLALPLELGLRLFQARRPVAAAPHRASFRVIVPTNSAIKKNPT